MGPSSSLSFSDITAFRHRPEIPVEKNLRQRRYMEELASDTGHVGHGTREGSNSVLEVPQGTQGTSGFGPS